MYCDKLGKLSDDTDNGDVSPVCVGHMCVLWFVSGSVSSMSSQRISCNV